MFLQVHYLTSYHASLLNRDDAGLAKRIPFGGADRLRISSQCQKRHWREWMMSKVEIPGAIRSRHFFSREIKERLVKDHGLDPKQAHELTLALAQAVLTAAGEKKALDPESLEMKQPVLLGKPEADYFVDLIKSQAENSGPDAKDNLVKQLKNGKKNLQVLMAQAGFKNPQAGLEGAMFGRFITSDILARVDAPVHVAHAFTTHALDTEMDYFTVVDDLSAAEETGAAHANDAELGAGLFYGYVAVDVPLLVSNLTGCAMGAWREQDHRPARAALDILVHAIAEVSPGAKLGATAPYARAEYIVLETGTAQPRSFANAFLQPVRFSGNGHPMVQSARRIADYIDALDAMYGRTADTRFVSTCHEWFRNGDIRLPLQEAIDRALTEICGGTA